MRYLSWNLGKTYYQNPDLFNWLGSSALRGLSPTEFAPKDLVVDIKI